MLAGFIAISVLLLFVLFLIMFRRTRNQRKASIFNKFAELHGLNYHQYKKFFRLSPEIKGYLNEHHVHIYEKVVGYGNSRKVYTIVQFTDCPHDFDFKIGKEGFFSKMGKLFGFKDIEFHDQDFDRTFLMKSTNENRFRALMDYKLQAELSRISHDLQGTIENENCILTYQAPGEILRRDKIERLGNVMGFMVQLQQASSR